MASNPLEAVGEFGQSVWNWAMGIKNNPNQDTSSDIYNVLDENGNVIKQLRYPVNSSMAQEARAAREAGDTWEVYDARKYGTELYEPVSSAKAAIDIDPIAGKVTVSGPKWLTSEVIKSDSFKKNVSENGALKSLISAYRQDPNSTISMKDGETMSAAKALGEFQKSAQDIYSDYAKVVLMRDQMRDKYGSELSDEQISIATSGQIRGSDTYNGSSPVYIPEWAKNMYDWKSLGSFNEETWSVSADDFFNNVYKMTAFNDSEGRVDALRKMAKEKMEELIDKNSYDRSNEELKKEREGELSDEDYKNELARTRAFYTWAYGNTPEEDALMGAKYFALGFVGAFTQGFADAAINIATLGMDLFEEVGKGLTAGNTEAAQATCLINPAYWALATLGTIGLALDSSDPANLVALRDDIGNALDSLSGSSNQMLADAMKNLKKEYDEGLNGKGMGATMETYTALGGGPAVAGAFFGNMAYKIIENVVVLNKAGNIAGALTAAPMLGKTFAETLPLVSKGIAFANYGMAGKFLNFVSQLSNVAVQGVLETIIDDKELIDNAFASGDLDSEVMDKIYENTVWNLIGEYTPVVGKGARKVVTYTTPGKALDMVLTKAFAGVGLATARFKKGFFTKLANFRKAADGEIIEDSSKGLGNKSIEFYDAQIKARKAILDLPILRAMTEEEKDVYRNASAYILTGKSAKEVEEMGTEEQKQLVKEMADKADSLSAGIKQNYAYKNVAVLNRMNIENNFDAILRGEKAKVNEMNAYAGEKYDNYSASLGRTLEMEKRAMKGGRKLTQGTKGMALSKESSEYLSYRSQAGRYEWLIGNKKLKGEKLKAAQKYLEFVLGRMGELETVLGKELTDQLVNHLNIASGYYASCLDYMMKKGYMSKEAAERILKLRNNEGWGANGEFYIPTGRLFSADSYDVSVEKFLGEVSADKMMKGETIPSDIKAYQMGDETDTFMDPTVVMYAHIQQMAKVAQAQDMWRALRANNLLARSLKDFDSDGFSVYDMTLIKQGSGKLKYLFNETFTKKSTSLSKGIKGIFGESRAAEMGLKAKIAQTRAEKFGETYRNTLVNSASNADINAIMSFAPENLELPNLGFDGVRKNTFDDWFEALPKNAKAELASRLGGQEVNFANVKSLYAQNPEVEIAMTKNWLGSEDAKSLWETKEAKEYLDARAKADMEASGNIVLREDADAYVKAQNLAHATRLEKADQNYRTVFAEQTKLATDTIINELAPALEKDSMDFGRMVKSVVDATEGRVSEEKAGKYIILLQLNNLKPGDIASMLKNEEEFRTLAKKLKEDGMSELNAKELKAARAQGANALAGAIKSQIESELNVVSKELADNGAGEVMDLDVYWESIKKYQIDVMKRGGKWLTDDVKSEVMDRHIVKAVNGKGDVQYFETDPNTALLVNTRPSYKQPGILGVLNQDLNQVFRLGTTGFDRISYINQWFRDSINAVIVGGARPFTDLGVKGKLGAFLSDYVPFGERIFGKRVTEMVSKEIVDSTYDSIRAGLVANFGEDYIKALEDSAAKGLTGEAASDASKRAVVEYSIQRSGYESLPSSGMREAESYRVTDGTGTSKKTIKQLNQERLDAMFNGNQKAFDRMAARMQRGFDNLMSDHLSRGQWRETFLRKSVFTSQYRVAIESGMTPQEARIWASRYAMDATTNFGRPLPIGNNFFRHVPYFSAAINGAQSFYRLLELDPVGVMTRFTHGLVLPYVAMLSQSLSDPKNLEAYKQIPEYEKSDSFVFFYEGHKISIPMPQELQAFLNPFRHMVEKAANANDNSWGDLVLSDALGIFPLDLSGFVDLDKKNLLDDPSFGDRVYRGLEKSLSSLMPPAVKAAYMLLAKRDPYTGQGITEEDTGYATFDDEGNLVMMDKSQSELAHHFAGKGLFKDISATGMQKILNSLLGRSTISVVDGALELFSGEAVSDGEFKKQSFLEWLRNRGNAVTNQLLSPVAETNTPYNTANTLWNRTIGQLNKEKEALITDKEFTKAFRVLQSSTATEEQRSSAMRVYREKLDEYDRRVLTMANNLKKDHPYAYTTTREAQVLSLLTLPTGLTYNETAYAKEVRQDSYYDANARAIATYLKMGFPEDHTEQTILGRGYYDGNGKYQFKIYTPYEIQYIQGGVFGTSAEVEAEINQTMKENNISAGDMWNLYYSASTKAERKQLMAMWNAKTVPLLAPIVQKYGVDFVTNNSAMSNALGKYIYADNSYKKKQYLQQIFGGGE